MKSMKTAFEKAHGKVAKEFTPGKYLLGSKLEQIQETEPFASPSTEVTTKEDGEKDIVVTDVDRNGRLMVKKGAAKTVKLPKDPEELRTRYRILGNAWLFAGARHGGREWLADFDENVFPSFADYVLGPKVYSLQATRMDEKGSTESIGATPDWDIILQYEYEMRKQVMDWVKEDNMTMKDAFAKVVKDSETRELRFMNPWQLRLNTAKVKKEHLKDTWSYDKGGGKKGGKGNEGKGFNTWSYDKGKGNKCKGKGKGKQFRMTPDGKPICFRFKNKDEKCAGCSMLHVCQVCFGDHPKYDSKCPGFPSGGSGK